MNIPHFQQSFRSPHSLRFGQACNTQPTPEPSGQDTLEITKEKPAPVYRAKPNGIVIRMVNLFASFMADRLHYEVKTNSDEIDAIKKLIKADNNVIITPNHSHALDSATVALGLLRNGVPTELMGAEKLFEKKWKRLLITRYGVNSVQRGAKDKSQTHENMMEVITGKKRRGIFHRREALTMFPEGFVSNNNAHLQPMKDGASMYAIEAVKRRPDTSTFVVPTAIYYDYENKKRMLVKILKTVEHIEKRFNEDRSTPTDFEKFNEAQLQEASIQLISRVQNLFDRMISAKETVYQEQYPELQLSKEGDFYKRLDDLRAALLNHIANEYDSPIDLNKSSHEQWSKRLMEVVKAHRNAEAKNVVTGEQEQNTENDTRLERLKEFNQHRKDYAQDIKMLKDITNLTMYPEGYLDEANILGEGSDNQILLNRVVEQVTILTRDLLGKYTPLYRNKKRFSLKGKTPYALSLMWSWRQGNIEANLRTAEPIDVKAFIADYYQSKGLALPNEVDTEDKALRSALTAEIEKRLQNKLSELEKQHNKDPIIK